MTHYIGELIQHDTSIHLWCPDAEKKWYLITSIDDHSRRLLYGDFWERETTWSHMVALKTVVTTFGCPLSYYVDNHAIFRFVARRDSMYRRETCQEEEATVQWKTALRHLGIQIKYALSPAAKGKVERPYQWLQDHIVRTCAREKISDIDEARKILYEEIYRYNCKRVHSATQEIPMVRYEEALEKNRSLFKNFSVKHPDETLDDIFCYRLKRRVNPYRRIKLNKLQLSISGVPLRAEVECRISLHEKNQRAKVRFWYQGRLVGEQIVQAKDIQGVIQY